MEREEIVRLLVLSSIGDDYENVDQIILPQVSRWGAKLGLSIERPEIVKALAWLVETAMAKAYVLSGREPHVTELDGMPPMNEIEEVFHTYFLITEKGMKVHRERREVLDNLDYRD